MKQCGWCGSEDTDYETIDNGVGRQQVTAAVCVGCGAVEIGPHDEEPISPIDKKRGWYAGPDVLQFVGPVFDSRVVTVRNEARRAWFCDYGTPVLVPWFGLTHMSYVENVHRKAQFRTNCGLVFDASDAPDDDHITCLICLCEETT